MRLGQTIFDKVKENKAKFALEEKAKVEKKRNEYLALVSVAKEILKEGKDYLKLTSPQLYTLLKPLRRHDGSKIPKGVDDRRALYGKWKDRLYDFEGWYGNKLKIVATTAEDEEGVDVYEGEEFPAADI